MGFDRHFSIIILLPSHHRVDSHSFNFAKNACSLVILFFHPCSSGLLKTGSKHTPPLCALQDNIAFKSSGRVYPECVCACISQLAQAARVAAQVCVFTAAVLLLLANQAWRRGRADFHVLHPSIFTPPSPHLCQAWFTARQSAPAGRPLQDVTS